ncbi:MAG: hypothetical protein EPO19_04330 [Betaproteobacteria bacterium]|nr:MAG: hypothetical protein EPO19_04330 [Betaproteobacteria bacterium]
MALTASIAVAQSVAWNLAGREDLLTFGFLNEIAGGEIWRFPGSTGGLARVSSVLSEPAHLIRVLGPVLGIVLARVGAFGRRVRLSVAELVSLPVAIVTVLAYFVAGSLIGIFELFVVMVVAWTLIGRGGIGTIKLLLWQLLFGCVLIAIFFLYFGEDASERLGTIDIVFSGGNRWEYISTDSVSSLAIATNREVMLESLKENILLGVGIGCHPISYMTQAPLFLGDSGGSLELNAMDGSGLLIRLLSETGLAGTALFIGALVVPILHVFKFVRSGNGRLTSSKEQTRLCLLTASFSGVLLGALGRYGSYVDPILWVSFGLMLGYSGLRTASGVSRT